MSFKKIFIFILIISTIFISACGKEPDCTQQDTTYQKYRYDKEQGKCILYKQIEQNKCGNGIKEKGETYCNCPADVQKTDATVGCNGNLGDYLSKTCDDFKKECILSENSKVISEQKTVEFKLTDLMFRGTISYKTPLIINIETENMVKMDLTLIDITNTDNKKIENIYVKELRIEDPSSKVLGKMSFNTKLKNIGESLPLAQTQIFDTQKYETKQTIRLKLDVNYDVVSFDKEGKETKREQKIQTITTSLAGFTIINPNFYKN